MPETNFRTLCEQLMELAEGKRYDGSAVIAKARAALAQPEPEILPKNCWLDDEPDIWPSPCVFEDPEEVISNCAHASVLHSEGKCKTDCQHYRQPTSGTH